MWSSIIGWIGNNYPILLVGLVAFCAAWFIAKFYFGDYRKVKDKVNGLPCSQHADNFKAIDDKLTKIITILTMKYPASAAAFSIKNSPRQLNEKGKELLTDCKGDEFLDKFGNLFIEMISQNNPQTALDVENMAYDVLASNQNMEIFNSLKQWVYNSPTWEINTPTGPTPYTITMSDICFVLSIPLRDSYLSQQPEIEQEA